MTSIVLVFEEDIGRHAVDGPHRFVFTLGVNAGNFAIVDNSGLYFTECVAVQLGGFLPVSPGIHDATCARRWSDTD